MTERLYEGRPLRSEADAAFSARVVSVAPRDGGSAVTLERTLFYPTGGGQPCDWGSLGGVAVRDVLEEGEEVVHLLPESVAWAAGQEVEGRVDLARRRDHMEQHSGQHLLSAVLLRRGIETLSFHLGREVCTIDVPATGVDAALLREVEAEANAAIRAAQPLIARTFRGEAIEAAIAGLRKPPEPAALASPRGVRIVQIGADDAPLDRDPCCGTHVGGTGELGTLLVLGSERGRQGEARISFVVGGRAITAWRARLDALQSACGTLTTGFGELPERVQKLLDQAKGLNRELKRAREKATVLEAEGLAHTASERVFTHVVDGGPGDLRAFARAYLAVRTDGLLALAHAGEKLTLAVALGVDVTGVDPGQVLRAVLTPLGGKGGGRGAFAQGAAPQGDAHSALASAARLLDEAIA